MLLKSGERIRALLCVFLCGGALASSGADRGDPGGHWAFDPPSRPPVPSVDRPAWHGNAIDRFILAELQERGLEPAPPADRSALIRRATFDLLGLPPEPTRVADFVNDPENLELAFARVVDGLLSSPHYGERWGRHWLDIARYGDSNGGDENHAYPNAYHYRNWVIDALNRDLPYDAFLREQLAGDLLDEPTPQSITATGFLALGTKILAEQDPVKKRADIVDEQIDTLGRALLGLTLGCARCHDHKFDPISQKEYYALAGIFHSSEIDNARGLESAAEIAAKAALRKKLAPLTDTIEKAEAEMAPWIDLSAERVWEAETFDRGNVIVDRENYGKGIGIISDPSGQLNYAEYDLDSAGEGPHFLSLRYAAAQSRPGKILLDGKVVIDPAVRETTGGWNPEHQAWRLEGAITLTPGKHILRIESEPMMSHIDKVKLSPVRDLAKATAALDRLRALRERRSELEAAIGEEPRVKVMAVRDGTVADARLNRRGDPHDLGSVVPRGVLRQVGPRAPAQAAAASSSGRRALASWMTRPGHPLTSRVLVNRVWRWHFGGKALVASPDDFGHRGKHPSHPKLLDYLAVRFEQEGWSLKKLHRAILLSQTWQMGTDHPEAAVMSAIDPENRYYWRSEARRLEAEAFRDAVLSVSGRLARVPPHGSPTSVKSQDPSPEDLLKNRRAYEDDPHRSVYLPVVRSHLYDLLTLLDFPNATTPVGERNETTVPTQALLMLNNPWLTRQAAALGERVRDGEDPVDRLYQILFARHAAPGEVEEATAFLRRYALLRESGVAAWTALCQTLIISNEFLYVR